MLFHYLFEISYCKSNDIILSLTALSMANNQTGIFPKKICQGSLYLNKQFYFFITFIPHFNII